jgi:hypothetical protein
MGHSAKAVKHSVRLPMRETEMLGFGSSIATARMISGTPGGANRRRRPAVSEDASSGDERMARSKSLAPAKGTRELAASHRTDRPSSALAAPG